MNERVKPLRKILGLSGEKFGEKLGLTRMAISNIENKRYNLTEQTILSICREFNVNENWLRHGEGEIFEPIRELDVTNLIEKNHIDEFEIEILRAYFTLDKEIRKQAIEHFKTVLSRA